MSSHFWGSDRAFRLEQAQYEANYRVAAIGLLYLSRMSPSVRRRKAGSSTAFADLINDRESATYIMTCIAIVRGSSACDSVPIFCLTKRGHYLVSGIVDFKIRLRLGLEIGRAHV